jgi:colanic acid/amylovoran biosynthesis glycosyltransferase
LDTNLRQPTWRIAYLIPEYPGQTHTFFWRELHAIRKLGVEVKVFSTQKPPSKIISHDWAKMAMRETTYLFPPGPAQLFGAFAMLLRCGPWRWWRCLRAVMQADVPSLSERFRLLPLIIIAAELAALIEKQGLSHIHVHMCGDVATIAMFAHLLRDIPYSLTLHNSLSEFGFNQKWKWRFAAFAIVISRRHLSEVQEELHGFLPPQVVVAPMGVDLAALSRQTSYHPWSGSGICRIFSCGRLNPQKNHGDLLRALHLVRNSGLDARLTIAGGDDSREEIHKAELGGTMKELSLDGMVELLGAVSEPVVQAELEKAHIFALASIHEGVPVSVMEAMAMKLPVVVTDVGGMRELVDDGQNGFIVPARHPELMAERLVTLLRNPDQAQEFSHAARCKIEQCFHSGISAETIVRLLETLSSMVQVADHTL